MPKRLALCVASLIAIFPTFAPATTVTWQRVIGGWAGGIWCGGMYAEGGDYSSVSLADIDGDGDLDMFAGNVFMQNIGTPQWPGWAAPVPSTPFGSPPQFCDINGDGDHDAFIGSTFYENTGTATSPTWAAPVPSYLPISGTPAFADIDADGDADLFAGRTFYQNTGTSQSPVWAAPVSDYLPVAGSPAFGDFDRDGDLDLFVAVAGGTITFCENLGTSRTATWSAALPNYNFIYTGHSYAPALADMDADGDVDLMVGSPESRVIWYKNLGMTGPGMPTWSPPVPNYASIDVGSYSKPAFADVDADGDLDLFVGNTSGTISFCENVGTSRSATWAAPVESYNLIDVGDWSAPAFADIDADGDFDLFIGQWDGSITFCQNVGTPQSALWAAPVRNYASIDVEYFTAPTFADIDGDGDLDFFVGEGYSVIFYQNIGTPRSPLWAAPLKIQTFYPATPALFDMDGDGDLDLFLGEESGQVFIYRNIGPTGAPSWAYPALSLPSISVGGFSAPAFADIDGDGIADMFLGQSDGTIGFSQGVVRQPRWSSAASLYEAMKGGGDYPFQPFFPALGDIDGDGDLDLFIGKLSKGTITFIENVGTALSPVWALPVPNYSFIDLRPDEYIAPHLTDIDADGDQDLFVMGGYGDFYFFENVGSPIRPSWTFRLTNYAGVNSGGAYPWSAFADIDADGDLDLFVPYWRADPNPRMDYYRNIGTARHAVWDWPVSNYFAMSGSTNHYVAFGDLDLDGDIDFLMDQGPSLGFYENIGTPYAPEWAQPRITLLDGPGGAFGLGDIDDDGDLDLFAVGGGGGIRLYKNLTLNLRVVPRSADIEFNHAQQFMVAGTTATVVWTLVQNRSGGTIDAATGLYVAGPVYNVEDVIEARDPVSGDRGRAWVKVVPPPFVFGEKIIICAGGGNYPGNSILTQTNYLADFAFRMSLERGYRKQDIYYLNADGAHVHDADGDGQNDADATATLTNLQWAISTWSTDARRLFIYMVDHGTQTQFRVNATQFLDGPTLDGWLDTLQNTHATTVIVVLDYCYSGSFVASCAAPPGRTRALFTSAGASELATFLAPYGYISFSNFFLGYAHMGANLFDCFAWTRDALNFTYAGQIPRIDDNGDGLSNKNDGYYARTQYWGFDYGFGATPPEIVEIPPNQLLNGETSTTFRCVVVPTLPVSRVWVTIIPPGGLTFAGGEPITNMLQVELQTTGTTTYTGTWNGFRENGQYTVTYYAIDNEGGVSWPKRAYIYQMSGPDAYEDDDAATQAKAIILDWPEAQRHNIHDAGDRDWTFAFLLGGGSYRIAAENVGSACDAVIELYNSTTATTPLWVEDNWGRGLPEIRTWVAPTTGTYYILVHDFDPATHGEGTSYSLSLRGVTGPNNGLAIALSAHHIRCSWDPASYANLTGYHLMRTTDTIGGSWIRVNPTPIGPGSNPQFDDYSVGPATFYFYKVLAIRDDATTPQHTPIFFTTTPSSWSGIVVTGGPLDFGDWDVDDGPTSSMAVTIRNDGMAPLNFTGAGIALTGANADQFAITNSPPTTSLAAGTSRTVAVAFDPTTTGAKTADLTITTDDTSEPTIQVALSGTGVDQEITVFPMALGFGTRDVNAGPTAPQTVTIRNDGTAPLNFTGAGITLTGPAATEYLITNSPATTLLSPGTSRTVAIVFDPFAVGARTAALTISTDDTNEPTVNVTLTGAGTGAAATRRSWTAYR